MIPYEHQVENAPIVTAMIETYGMAYLAWEERTGKTLTAILAIEGLSGVEKIQVVTQKKAIAGWEETLAAFKHKKQYSVTNFHNAHKQDKPDLVIIDEAHNFLSAFPKPGKIWREMRILCKGLPLLYLSATPHAQGVQMLYHQFALSYRTPWILYPNFYSWFKSFGHLYQIEMQGRKVNQYDKCDIDFVLGCVDHLFLTKTRQELGFAYEPEDKIHHIELNEMTKLVYNDLLDHNLVELNAGTLVCDTTSKLRFSLHMLEGGTAKIDEQRFVLANREKVDHILEHFGDTKDLVIMYNYIAEREKLEAIFEHAAILQATSYAEGVDLHEYKDLVIYSQDFRTAKHTQRRARQANIKRDTPIIVHFLIVKKAISHQVYKTVSKNKKNFVDSVFERTAL